MPFGGRRMGLTAAGAYRRDRRRARAEPPRRRPRRLGSRSMANSENIVGLLAKVPVFEALAPDDVRRVADVAVPRRFAAQQVIFREGDSSDTCYVVRKGHARALRENTDGRMIALAHFGPGDIFGELAMFDDERRSATVETLDAVEAIAIAGSDMRRLLREHPDIAVKLVIALGRRPREGHQRPTPPALAGRRATRPGGRVREPNERLPRQSFQTVQSRVAGVLGRLVEQAQTEGAGERDGLVQGPPGEIAQLAGSSRESASRFLAVLERAGIITQGRGRITVHDPEALERYIF